ncbi:MAG: hypothetical protein AAF480_05660 [Actinomycetota bacterium]
MERAHAAGRLLAERHLAAASVDPEPAGSLVNYAESARAGDWSLRSALVRLAQPEPARVAGVLELVRRLDAVLHHLARPLERHTVVCDRSLNVEAVTDESAGWRLAEPAAPYPDTRVADLVRLVTSAGAEGDRVLDAYLGEVELEVEEQQALPLLGVAVELDTLAEVLVTWAPTAPEAPPVETVDGVCHRVLATLDALGVPREEGPPPGARSGRRRSP